MHPSIQGDLNALRRGFPVLILTLCLAACLRTVVPRQAVEPEVFELAASNLRAAQVSLSASDGDLTVGHQYLFMFIPFGRIVVERPVDHLRSAAYRQISLARIRPVIGDASAAAQAHLPRLEVDLQGLQLSAYDFVFTRRIVCRFTITIRRFTPGARLPAAMVSREVAESEFVRYAFAPELQDFFKRTLESSIAQLLSEVGMRI